MGRGSWRSRYTVDNDLALKIYIKARAKQKLVAAFAERRELGKILIYLNQVTYTLDYLFLLQTIIRADQQGAVKFALMLSQIEGGCRVDYNTPIDLFLQVAADPGILLKISHFYLTILGFPADNSSEVVLPTNHDHNGSSDIHLEFIQE
ncbi:hypothetical protein OROGR_004456 [Orobanche gracilis]